VTLVPGDGIGKEVTDSVKEIFEALKVPVQWEQYDVSGETTGGDALFQQAMDSLRRNKVGLKGLWGSSSITVLVSSLDLHFCHLN
jgi:isocitrate dehydrogenase (NAD+)